MTIDDLLYLILSALVLGTITGAFIATLLYFFE